MKQALFSLIAVSAVGLAAIARGAELDQLRVLFVGDTHSPRAKHFAGFLQKNVGRVAVAERQNFKPAQATNFDVILLDWPQSELAREERSRRSPLGDRATWTTPTVLLGSAGLNLAVVWKVRGGSG